jgi:hypothetical protein
VPHRDLHGSAKPPWRRRTLMSFLRHLRSIVRWGLYSGRKRSVHRFRPLTVSMSRSQLFLGRLLSSRACLRFVSRSHVHANRLVMQL